MTVLTTAAAVAAALDPALAPNTRPHPTLNPTVSAWASILAVNARVLALPFLLAVCGFARGRWSRRFGDAAVLLVFGQNAVRVGLALGRWQGQLIPYLPHLPLEWAAAALAAGTWVQARRHPSGGWRGLTAGAVIVLVLLVVAAAVEVLLTPHARGHR